MYDNALHHFHVNKRNLSQAFIRAKKKLKAFFQHAKSFRQVLKNNNLTIIII